VGSRGFADPDGQCTVDHRRAVLREGEMEREKAETSFSYISKKAISYAIEDSPSPGIEERVVFRFPEARLPVGAERLMMA
jgi:hypothetical protein